VYGAVVRAPYKGMHRANFTHRRAHVRGSPKGSLRAFGGSEKSDAPTEKLEIFAIFLKLKFIFAFAKMHRNVFEENISLRSNITCRRQISLAAGEYHSRFAGISLPQSGNITVAAGDPLSLAVRSLALSYHSLGKCTIIENTFYINVIKMYRKKYR